MREARVPMKRFAPPTARFTFTQPRNIGGRALIPLLGSLSALAMAVATVGLVFLLQEREKRQAKERELEIVRAENADLKTHVTEAQQAKARLEEDITRVRKDLALSQEQLAKATATQQTLSRSLQEREQTISQMTKELEETNSQSQHTAQRLAELQTEHEAATQQFAELERVKNELEAKMMELSARPTMELEKVFVRDQPSSGDVAPASSNAGMSEAAAPAAAETSSMLSDGRVVVVNREYDFIVMNLGKNQGIAIGQELQIVRDHSVLGKVKVEKVYDELSAATILPESQKESIREGDLVKAI